MPKYTWDDYRMTGPPTFDYGDFTTTAFGREEAIGETVTSIGRHAQNSTRYLRRLVYYWGSGKSTYLYNLCHSLNKDYFFSDQLEDLDQQSYLHVLGVFLKTPLKRSQFLKYVLSDGLPIPWGVDHPKRRIEEDRRDQWKDAVRKLAFLLLRRTIATIKRKGYVDNAVGLSEKRKKVFDILSGMDSLHTMEFIKKCDEEYGKDTAIFDEAAEVVRFYTKMIMPSIEMRKGVARVSRQADFETEFPKLLYPVNSQEFLDAYKVMFGTVEFNLANFLAFERLLKETETAILVALDEVEDWSSVVKGKVDIDLHDMIVDAESPVSVILTFRTEIMDKINNQQSLSTFKTIHDRLTNLVMNDLTDEEKVVLTGKVLSPFRKNKEETMFPCTEEFVKALAAKSRRSGGFNPRSYLKALSATLDLSLDWERKSAELSPDFLDSKEATEAVRDVLKAADKEAQVTTPTESELET